MASKRIAEAGLHRVVGADRARFFDEPMALRHSGIVQAKVARAVGEQEVPFWRLEKSFAAIADAPPRI